MPHDPVDADLKYELMQDEAQDALELERAEWTKAVTNEFHALLDKKDAELAKLLDHVRALQSFSETDRMQSFSTGFVIAMVLSTALTILFFHLFILP